MQKKEKKKKEVEKKNSKKDNNKDKLPTFIKPSISSYINFSSSFKITAKENSCPIG